MVRSLPQNKHCHAIIGEIARAKGVDRELAKRVLICRFREETERDPTFALLWPNDLRSSKFPPVLAAGFIDFCYAWKAHHVVEESPQTHGGREGSPRGGEVAALLSV